MVDDSIDEAVTLDGQARDPRGPVTMQRAVAVAFERTETLVVIRQ
ncbi:MAG: hypothetical protein ACRD12_06430 [Acidimicrobiales bacterium]